MDTFFLICEDETVHVNGTFRAKKKGKSMSNVSEDRGLGDYLSNKTGARDQVATLGLKSQPDKAADVITYLLEIPGVVSVAQRKDQEYNVFLLVRRERDFDTTEWSNRHLFACPDILGVVSLEPKKLSTHPRQARGRPETF